VQINNTDKSKEKDASLDKADTGNERTNIDDKDDVSFVDGSFHSFIRLIRFQFQFIRSF
jgi:hypothetical protein